MCSRSLRDASAVSASRTSMSKIPTENLMRGCSSTVMEPQLVVRTAMKKVGATEGAVAMFASKALPMPFSSADLRASRQMQQNRVSAGVDSFSQ